MAGLFTAKKLGYLYRLQIVKNVSGIFKILSR